MNTVVIRLFDLYGSEVRSRFNIEKIKDNMDNSTEYAFDMDNVSFISRSVADELCIIKENYSVELFNMTELVNNMINAVSVGRSKSRLRKESNADIVDCNDMNSLSELLLSMQ